MTPAKLQLDDVLLLFLHEKLGCILQSIREFPPAF
jgi:hypothetical protein